METAQKIDAHKTASAAAQEGVVDPIAALDQEFVLPSASTATETSRSQKETTLQCQSFRVGDVGLLCSRDASREVLPPPAVSRIPNTAPWFKGLANVRGGLTPMVDLATALGVDRNEATEPYLLVFGHGEESIGLLIDGLPTGRILQVSEKLAGLPPVPDILHGCVTAAYDHAGSVWLELDIERFFLVLADRIGT